MKCEPIEELLSLYIEGELTPEEKAAVEGHLRSCPACTLLLSALDETCRALSGFPELEVSGELLSKLTAIPTAKRKFSFSQDFLLKPSLQPVFAAASVFLTLVSFYLFNPNKKAIDRSIEQQLRLGYSQAEKIYAKAGSFTDRLGDRADNVFASIKNWKIFGANEDQTPSQEE
jgi:anti-sigma factor RsiW